MKIAFLGYLPAVSVFDSNAIRPSHRGFSHPAPWVAALLPALARLTDFELRAFLPQRAITKKVIVERDGVEYEGLPVGFSERWNPQTGYLVRSLAVHKALKEYQPDLIHAFGIESGNATVALRTGIPTSCFIQGIVERYYPFIGFTGKTRRFCQRRIERSAVKRLKWMIAETQFAKQWALEWNPSAHVDIIPHPVRTSFLKEGIASGNKHIVSVGGIDTRKAMDVAVKAFAKVEDTSARLTIVGGGCGTEELSQLVRDLGLVERVKLAGRLDSESVLQTLKSASIFVITSRMDTSPNVLTEAHAMGLPVIGTRAGGIPEMIDEGDDGFLIDVDDIDALAQKMQYLLANPDVAQRMGLAGRAKVAVWNDPAQVAKAHVEFFERIRRELP